jgi:hypothetical protein
MEEGICLVPADLYTTPQHVKDRAAKLGMPSNVPYSYFPINGLWFGKRWRDYQLEVFGYTFPVKAHYPTPEELPEPFLYLIVNFDKEGELVRFSDGSMPHLIFQVWQQKIRYRGSNVFAEVKYHPEDGEDISILNIERDTEPVEISRVHRGIEILGRSKIAHIGRPRGSGYLDGMTPKEFLAHYNRYKQEYGAPTQYDLAAKLSVSRSTLQRYLRAHGIPWPPA